MDARFAQDVLGRLQELTQKVAAEVDQHTECVEEINAQLRSAPEPDEAAVVAAVAHLIEANQRMRRELQAAEERLQAQARQIERQALEARTDPLTRVANRWAFDEEFRRCRGQSVQQGTPTTLMLLDVDHFKRFNDSLGHQAGDDALRHVAETLKRVLGDVALIARYGGEEFAALFPGMGAEAAIPYCEQARLAIANARLRINDREHRITVSLGVAQLLPGETECELLQRADAALYASKNAGRNCGHLHDGRLCRLLRAAPAPALPSPAFPEGVGDEWIFQPELCTQTLFREPIANVAPRPAFFDELIRRLSQLRKHHTPLSLVLVQVEGYAHMVGQHGPSAAEVVLRITAQLINATLRDLDQVTRIAEDTFALLLPGMQLADAQTLAQKIVHAAQRCTLPRRAAISALPLRVGVVEAAPRDDLRRLLQRARAALTGAGEETPHPGPATSAAPTVAAMPARLPTN
ncbi:MAG: diguanylate cyclase [Alteraurantiacibacter sp.]|nr:diguanylate cyclase [Alteraurantiacibacter sp.]